MFSSKGLFTEISRHPHKGFKFFGWNAAMKTTIDLPEPVYQSVMEQARAAGSPVARWIEAVLIKLVSERPAKPPLEEDMTDWRSELL